MLKHASNTGGGGGGGIANGQLRNNPSNSNATSAVNRSIHLRPQQPLNISTLSTTQNALQTSSTSVTANGGQRIPTLLNIASTPIASGAANTNVAVTPLSPNAGNATATRTSTTPVTPLTPNGIGNNLHTYTNQHILASNNYTNNNNNTLNNTTATATGTINNNINNNNHNHNAAHYNNHNYSNCHNLTAGALINQSKHGPGPREALTSLGLLCLVSLLLALLSLIFLLKISPNAREDALTRSSAEDFVIVYDVTLALCALSLSLNLCCLLVCAIQFLFAVKLVRSPMFDGRDNKYLEKSSASRTCAVGGFFISIPIFLTG
ncbi:PREDICTED: probable WRKY transcription factor protein 1 [Rhagoletis zephyria]|uniref:probable WRKY transcription factor protein 1 n=1 Tax=Rhagoletis zephyria TaxID=28612 RepID=UPI00081166C7|nr:PREDICTED: probable WRKY transcription factor protein 1 [Rhagoletis zephyria]